MLILVEFMYADCQTLNKTNYHDDVDDRDPTTMPTMKGYLPWGCTSYPFTMRAWQEGH